MLPDSRLAAVVMIALRTLKVMKIGTGTRVHARTTLGTREPVPIFEDLDKEDE